METKHSLGGAVALLLFGVLVGAVACTGMLASEGGDEPCVGDGDCAAGFVCLSGGCHQEVSCVDEDGDGFFSGACTGTETPDCDDSDPARYPGRDDVCGDEMDNNCNYAVDELCECAVEYGVGTTRDCEGRGACAAVQTCNDDGWGGCVPDVMPRFEQCGPTGSGDGVDDDCDGPIDEDCCGPRPDGMGTEIACPSDMGDSLVCSSNGTCR